MVTVTLSVIFVVLVTYHAVQEFASIEAETSSEQTESLNPIVLISGYNGNRLEANLDRQEVPYEYCERKSNGWFEIWLNASDYEQDQVNCFMDNMSLMYNSDTHKTSNRPGVSIRARFDKTYPLEYYSSMKDLEGSPHFNVLVQRLVDLGYERNKNVLGAAYDFRKAPNELMDYFEAFAGLVERAYLDNGEKRVVILCHSLGCPYSLFFLQSKSDLWKSTYISSLLALSGSWAGSVNRLMAFVSGGNYNIITMPDLKRTDVITWPSTVFSLPSSQVFPLDQVLVRDTENQYTAEDYEKLFETLQYPTGYEIYQDVADFLKPLEPPGVVVHCFHGYGIDTVEQLAYNTSKLGKFFNAGATPVQGPGDGFINLVSLKTCLNWPTKQKEPIYYMNFSSVSHNGMLNDENVFEYIKEALQMAS